MHREKHNYVYIMTNPSKTLYTGMTNNLQRRVEKHKQKLLPGFTSKYNLTRLAYFEVLRMFATRSIARRRSKHGRGAKRVALIESKNPKWDDLTREWNQPQTFRFQARTD